MLSFTVKKFLSLSKEKQHKECALILKKIYDTLLKKNDPSVLWNLYSDYMSWMEEDIASCDLKLIADAFHYHINKGKQSLKEHNFLPRIETKDKKNPQKSLGISIILDNIRSAHNVGSIIRTSEALSLGTLYFKGLTPLPTNKQVIDTSMGTFEWIKWETFQNFSNLSCPLIALETSLDAIPINEYIFPESFTLALGNEEYGCSDETLKAADTFISIPLFGRKNSLNVANAFAIAAHQIRQQVISLSNEF